MEGKGDIIVWVHCVWGVVEILNIEAQKHVWGAFEERLKWHTGVEPVEAGGCVPQYGTTWEWVRVLWTVKAAMRL